MDNEEPLTTAEEEAVDQIWWDAAFNQITPLEEIQNVVEPKGRHEKIQRNWGRYLN